MGIKLFETRASLKSKLRNRNLKFDDDELDRVLVSHNYFTLFNGLENVFLETSSPKTYKNIKLKDFLCLYAFDKQLCSILSQCLDTVEEKLKASIAHNFAAKHCTSLNDTMQYTNKNNYMDPANGTPGTPTYCRYSSTYPFASNQNRKTYNGFNSFSLFTPYYLSNLVNQNDHIDSSFYQDPAYTAPPGVATYRDRSHNPNPHVAVPFWVAIETMTFGEILMLLHYLQDDVLQEVMNDFGIPLSKRAPFLNMIDFLVCLRNSCAHTVLLTRFSTADRFKINALLITSFSLNPKNANSVLKLYDVIKILSFFTDVSELKKPLRKLKYQFFLSLGITKGKTIYKRVLTHMGCSNYSDWITILSPTTTYTL